MSDLPTREQKIRAIHQVMHPGVGWDSCDKFWCQRKIPAFVDDRLIDRWSIDPLAACIGYGIEYQEAVDIVALALGGRDGLDELRQRLYDDAALGIGGDDE